MALEDVVFQQDCFNYDFQDQQNPEIFVNWESQNAYLDQEKTNPPVVDHMAPLKRRRRIRSIKKSKEDVENQRMTHIAVERNRRKQMNHHLNILRSIMPSSYSQRGDQASIIGGAINYVKELEQLLQTLEAQKRKNQQSSGEIISTTTSLFSDFFTFPQYSTSSQHQNDPIIMAENRSVNVADVEVTIAEKHANIKILTERQTKRLMKIVGGLHSLGLTILHLNVTTVDNNVLYCINVKFEDHCKLNSANEIAAAVNEMVGGVHEAKEKLG